jgi:hypothetical protein
VGRCPGSAKVFQFVTDWLWDPPSLLRNGYLLRGNSFSGVKRQNGAANYQFPTRVEIKNEWSYILSSSVSSGPGA